MVHILPGRPVGKPDQMSPIRAAAPSSYYYSDEVDGQIDFFREFGIDPDIALIQNTDGVHRGNLLEFKVSIGDVNKVLFQAIKYLSRLRVRGHNVPANILLVDLNKQTIYKFASADYFDEIHQIRSEEHT